MENNMQFTADVKARSIYISRTFKAPLANVWRAFTESELLDRWWGPAPWRAETRLMDFRPGGYWLYAMVGPGGERHWSRVNYLIVNVHKNIEAEDGFCDEDGNMNLNMPLTRWNNIFSEMPEGTRVEFKLLFSREKDLETIVSMGFEEGFTQGLRQLEVLLAEG